MARRSSASIIEIERDVSSLEANLRRFLPDSDINVEIVSDNIVLTGTVRTPLDSTRVDELARAFIKGGEATTRSITAQGTNGDADIFAEDRQASQIVNLLTDRWRRPGHAEGDRGRSPPPGPETARLQRSS